MNLAYESNTDVPAGSIHANTKFPLLLEIPLKNR